MDKILFILVTCTRERTRQLALDLCIDSIRQSFPKHIIDNNFIVFDNDSTVQETHDLINKNFRNVLKSSKNIGLWSSVSYVLNNYDKIIGKKFDFIFPIESDMIFYNTEKLDMCLDFLEKNSHLTSMRLKEIDLSNLEKFDKLRNPNMRSVITMKNMVTSEKAFFKKTDNSEIFLTNLCPIIPSLHRTKTLIDVMSILKGKKDFTEFDFWKAYDDVCNGNCAALLNMGMFYEPLHDYTVLTSANSTNLYDKIGYHNSRQNNAITLPDLSSISKF